MAAAYAALVSLMNTVDAIPNNPCVFTSLDEYQTESLREKIDYLLQFVVDYDFRGGKTKDAVEDLKSQIGSAAHAAEVVIEAHIVDRIITDPSRLLQKMIVLMRFFNDKFDAYSFRVSRAKELIEDLKTEIKFADVMISHEAKEWNAIQGITKEAVEDLKTLITSAARAAGSVLYFLKGLDYRGGPLSEQSQMIKEEMGSLMENVNYVKEQMKHSHDLQKIIQGMGSLIDKKTIEVMRSLIEEFEHYDYHEDIIKEGLDDLKSQIESLAHATHVKIIEGAKESVQKDPTQGITKEAVEDLKTLIAPAARAAKVMLNFVKNFDFRRPHISEQSQKIKEEMDSLMKKDKYVKEQRKHEEQSLDLQKIIEDMGSLIHKVYNVEEQMEHEYQMPTDSMPTAAPSRSYSTAGNMVGFDGYMYQLKDRLTGDRSERQVIPITGMGGIGKTTLARNVYDDLLIVQHFDKRAWVTVSQEYSVGKILVETLSSVGGSTCELDEKSEKLGGELYKILFDRRYLIILDDMWSIDAWEKLHSFFPKQKNGSRIVVTTRQSDMAKYFDTSALILSFLDDDKSWQLFHEKVFAYEDCPPELEWIGRKIVKKCGGLPLSIAVIGGLLQKSSRVQEYWANVEKDMSSIVNSAEENLCSDILSLSYNHLPTPLKPCFLYLGIFPEDSEIPVIQLVRLWVAEGFLKPNKDQSLEEVGEGYVKDLEDRNLIVVRPFCNYAVQTFCKVHDLLRELCIRTAEKEKFFCVMSGLDTSRHIDREGLSVFHKIILRDQGHPQLLSLSVRGETQHQNCELWRVVFDHAFTKSTWEQVSLRYSEGNVPWYKHPPLGWNLQTYMDREAPFNKASLSEIWEMTQLRHVEAEYIHLPDPPSGDYHDRIVLENLQTLGTVVNFKFSEEVCKRMPNIKKLSIEYHRDYFMDKVIIRSTLLKYISNVGRFNKLESLKYFFYCLPLNRDELLQNLKFPKSLKKLRLIGCGLHWDDLTIIGSLPHLEVLKLDDDAVQGVEWNPIENQFRSLKSLLVKSFDLLYWNVESSHFPILEKLTLQTPKLNEIPQDIGEIPTLRDIYLSYCGVSVAISALKILKLQENYGNNDIKVFVVDNEAILKKVREWMELERISTDNVRLSEYQSYGHLYVLKKRL